MPRQNVPDETRIVDGRNNESNSKIDFLGRRRFLKGVGAGAGTMAFSRLFADTPLGPNTIKRPNIVFVFDDQYRRDMSKFIDTSAADRLAREGITFPNYVSTTPLCTPFRGMLMTGRYPTHSGIVLNFVNASPVQNPDCLANVFDKAGYNTGFIGKWHLTAGFRVGDGLYKENLPLQRAYQKAHPDSEYVSRPERLGFQFWQGYNFNVNYNNYWYYEDAPKKIYSHKYETDTNIDQAIDYIEKHKNLDKPFLLCVAPHPPHPPWIPASLPEGYLDKVPKAEDLYQSPNVVPKNDPMYLEKFRIYLAMAKNMDDNLGRLMNYLDKSGVGDDTILIYTSDHGEMGGSHGERDKMVPYAEAVNVPLIMRWPGEIPAGSLNDDLYTPIDHLPTLCGLTGISAPSMADGEDLSSVVLRKARSPRDSVLMANYTSHWDFFQSGTQWPEWRGVHTKRYTYAKFLAGKEMLFDNLSDPYQMHNLVEEEGTKMTLLELRWKMKELMISAHDDFLSGTQYASWYDGKRNLVKTALGLVHR